LRRTEHLVCTSQLFSEPSQEAKAIPIYNALLQSLPPGRRGSVSQGSLPCRGLIIHTVYPFRVEILAGSRRSVAGFSARCLQSYKFWRNYGLKILRLRHSGPVQSCTPWWVACHSPGCPGTRRRVGAGILQSCLSSGSVHPGASAPATRPEILVWG